MRLAGSAFGKPFAAGARPPRAQVLARAATTKQSRVGVRPIPIPTSVTVNIDGSHVRVKVRFGIQLLQRRMVLGRRGSCTPILY